MKSVKVVHITSAHDAFDTRIFWKECRSLAEAGYEVVLIVPHDRSQEVVDRVRIRGISRNGNRFRRMTGTVFQAYRAAIEEDGSSYHFHDPELLPLAILLKARGRKVIFDWHEDLSLQVLVKEWIPKPLRSLISVFAYFLMRISTVVCDRTVAATPSVGETLSGSKTVIVQNYPIIESPSANGSVPYCQRPPRAIYIGSISLIRGIKEMTQAMTLISSEIDAHLIMAGEFQPSGLLDQVKCLPGWDRTRFVGYRPNSEVAQLLAGARVGLVLLHPTPNYIECQPIKLYEYMTAGLPVVASDFPLWRNLVKRSRCGLLVDPTNPKAIAEAIEFLLRNPKEAEQMGRRGRQAASAIYNWRVEVPKLLGLYEEVL